MPLHDVPDSKPGSRDILDQQHLEQRLRQNEKMAAIGELSTYMAHEIRNPLFSIGGFANALLRNTSLDAPAREKARIIFDEARRLDVILTSILNFARPTEQAMGIFEPETVARQTMDLMTLGGEERGIHANTVIAPNLPKVRGNAENLKQCLINLVKNAMEAMSAGGSVTMRLARDDGHVVIDVEDTGPGISPELHDQIFSPFFTTKKGGAGLGLAMTRKVIEEMGGKVLLASQPGQGTRVTLTLPAALDVAD
jgi:signal transduction histidine kinase